MVVTAIQAMFAFVEIVTASNAVIHVAKKFLQKRTIFLLGSYGKTKNSDVWRHV